ncbi:MAG: hypothetical protein KatS3mg040_0187 [Candidatus Kapaibacterium sp.]|nr:MAG: hypothetical protein KatS3mg040_0187 [Candidatus Kapabacteria bacterium]
MGMVATNTIGQGDTRESGLAVILQQGGAITFARRFIKWPGAANVEVNLVAIYKSSPRPLDTSLLAGEKQSEREQAPLTLTLSQSEREQVSLTPALSQRERDRASLTLTLSQGEREICSPRPLRPPLPVGEGMGVRVLDGQPVDFISSRLDAEPEAEPKRLPQNEGKAFIGDTVRGIGFVLEPEEAEALLAKDPRNADCLFPYLNGEDLNSHPEQKPSRWVICFHDWPLERAQQYPDLLRIVEERVKPERERLRGPRQNKRNRRVLVAVRRLRARACAAPSPPSSGCWCGAESASYTQWSSFQKGMFTATPQ